MRKTKLFLALIGFFTIGQLAFAQPGSTFSNSDTVFTLPLLEVGATTCGFGDNYTTLDIACTGNFMTGDEKIYSFTPSVNMPNVQVSMTNISDNFSGLFVTDDSTSSGNCLGSATGIGNADRVITGLSLTGGITYYVIVSSWANPQCIASYDLQILDQTCPAPAMVTATGVSAVSANIGWMEMGAATQWSVEYGGPGYIVGTGTSTVTSTNPLAITGLTAQSTYDVYVRAICGAGDSSYWVGPLTITTPCAAAVTPWTDDVETHFPTSNGSIANCWSSTPPGPTFLYRWNIDGSGSTPSFGTGPVSAHSGSNYFYTEASVGGILPVAELITIPIDLSSLTIPQLSFFYHMYGATMGDLYIDVYDGSTWTMGIDSLIGQQQSAQSDPWLERIISLSGYSGVIQVRFRAIKGTSFTGDICLDDISVTETPSCPQPQALFVDTITTTSAILSWTEVGSATQWDIEYGTLGFTQGTGTVIPLTTTNPYSVSGLSSGTTYEFYVRSVCSALDSSAWSGPFAFMTVPDYCAGSHFYDNGGQFGDYSNNSNDTTVICATNPGDIINTVFNSFSLESGWDYLYIYDGDNTSAPLLGQFSGTTIPGPFLASSLSGCFTFVFTSDGSVTRPGWDMSVSCITPPTCPAISDIAITALSLTSSAVSWVENGSSTQWEIEYGVTGFTQGTGTNVVTSTNPDTIAGLTASTSYDYYVKSICAVGDSSFWVGPFTYEIRFVSPLGVNCTTGGGGIIFSDDMESNTGWTGDISTSSGDWDFPTAYPGGNSFNTGPSGPASGTTFAEFEASGSGTTIASMVTPMINLTSATSDAELSFYMHAFGSAIGTLNVGISNSATGPFTTIFTTTGQVQTAATDPWSHVGVNIGSYVGQQIYIEFSYGGTGASYTADLAIDLVQVEACVTCPAPSNLTSSNVTGVSADLAWMENGSATQWQVEYGIAGFTPGTGTTVIANSNPFTLTSISASSVYDYYVRSICGASDSSLWAGPGSFITPCAPIIAPFTESFNTPSTPLCWSQTAISGGPWVFNGTPGYGASGASDHTGNGGEFIWMDFSGTDIEVSLITNDIDVSSLTTPYLEFYFYTNNTNNASINDLYVESWDGTAWIGIDTISQNLGGWVSFGYDISSFTFGTSMVRLRFRAESGGASTDFYQDFLLDDISVMEMPSCFAPQALAVSGATGTTAMISWSQFGSTMLWQVEYDTAGFVQGTGNIDTTSSNPYMITGLVVGNSYDVYVRSICSVGDTSIWTGPSTFLNGYCTPNPSSVDGQGITNVTMDTLNNTTGLEPGNYGDYSSMIAVGFQGATLPISITLQTGYTYNLWAWVDWNNDLDFDDAGEAFYLGQSSNVNPTTYVGQILIPLSASVGNHRIRIGGADFGLGTTGQSFPCYTGSWGCLEDYTLLVNTPSCLSPGPIVEDSITAFSVDLSWTENGSATLWEYEYGAAGFVLGAGLVLDTTTSNPINISGLTPSSDYEFYVRSICTAGDSSFWTGPFAFSTPCEVVTTFPFNETFDIASATVPSPSMPCWSVFDSTGNGALFYVTSGNFGGSVSNTVASQYNLVFLNLSNFGATGSHISDFISPTFDLTSLAIPTVSFWYSNEIDFGFQNEIRLLHRTSSSDPWSEIWMDTNNVDAWTEVVLPIPNASASSQFALRVTLNTGYYGTGVSMDEFRVYDGPELGNDTVLCTNDAITLDPGTFEEYLWSDTTISATNFMDAAVLPVGTDTVSVIITDSTGFKMYDTIVVTVEKPVVNLGSDSVLCYGFSITLDADTGFATYLWNDNSTMQTLATDGSVVGTTDYSVIVNTANNCPAYDTVSISVNTQVLVDLGVDTVFSDSNTQGTSYLLDAGPGFASYLWNDANATTTQTLLTNSTVEGVISVIVTNVSGCEGTDTVTVDFRLAIKGFEVSTLKMYPNPATDRLTIEVSNFNNLDGVDVTILDITGKIVMQDKLEGSTNTFNRTYDVSKFATGTYFVQFESNGEVVTRQFVIR